MGNKRWHCARVGKCNLLKPCKNFVRFRPYIFTREVAALCRISERTLFRKLKRDAFETLVWIECVSGFTFIREFKDSVRNVFVLEPNNTENSIKLSLALQKLEEEENGRI